MIYNIIWKSWLFVIFRVRASKMGLRRPSILNFFYILKAQVMSFLMIYNMLCYEKVDFLSFFMYELQNGLKMSFKPKNNYRILKYKFSAFQWYITCHDMKKWIFVIFWCMSFKMDSKWIWGWECTASILQAVYNYTGSETCKSPHFVAIAKKSTPQGWSPPHQPTSLSDF